MTPDQSADGRSFIKMHGLQNHFVIVDGRDSPYSPDREEVVRICNPATGVGADQLIIIEDANERADVRIRILNSDGHEAQACGNGTRCVAWLLFEETGARHSDYRNACGRTWKSADQRSTGQCEYGQDQARLGVDSHFRRPAIRCISIS